VSGCATWKDRQKLPVLPPTEAPLIVMNAVSTLQVIPVSNSAPLPTVEVLDHRPGPERYYYPGSLEPRRWPDGMSMVPMEAFDPTIEDQIRAHCFASLSRNDLSAVSIEVTSFQLVFDQRQKLKEESEYYRLKWIARKEEEYDDRVERRRQNDKEADERERADRKLRRSFGEDVDEPSIGDNLTSDAVRGLFRIVVLDTPREGVESARARDLRKPLPSQTPHFIANGKQEGLNCQIRGNVRLTYQSGEEDVRMIEAVLHQPVNEEFDVQTQIAELVDVAVRQFCESATAKDAIALSRQDHPEAAEVAD
ncbi:MAG: hypothetical protein ACK58L_08740, partial [Planctomycetota bacterium]